MKLNNKFAALVVAGALTMGGVAAPSALAEDASSLSSTGANIAGQGLNGSSNAATSSNDNIFEGGEIINSGSSDLSEGSSGLTGGSIAGLVIAGLLIAGLAYGFIESNKNGTLQMGSSTLDQGSSNGFRGSSQMESFSSTSSNNLFSGIGTAAGAAVQVLPLL